MSQRTNYCIVLLFALGMLACKSSGGDFTLIGATCTKSSECDITGVCITDAPGGMCALPCNNPGQAQECPYGAYCDSESVTTDTADKSLMTLCLPSCKKDSDCRTGYACQDLSSGPGKVCQPK